MVIRAEHLSKKYYIGMKQESYSTLRDTISEIALSPFRSMSKLLHGHILQRQRHFSGLGLTATATITARNTDQDEDVILLQVLQ